MIAGVNKGLAFMCLDSVLFVGKSVKVLGYIWRDRLEVTISVILTRLFRSKLTHPSFTN